MKRALHLALAVSLTVAPMNGASANSVTAVEAVKISTRLGASVAKAFLAHETLQIPPSGLAPEARSEAVETALARYQLARNLYSGASTGTQMVKAVAAAGFAVGTIYTGGALPIVLLGVGSAASLEMTDLWIETRGKENTGLLLAALSKDLMAETGAASVEELLAEPDRIVRVLREKDAFLKDIKARAKASGDDRLLDVATEALEAFAANVEASEFELLVETAGTVADLDKRFTNFVVQATDSLQRIDGRLAEQQELIAAIQVDVTTLREQVAVLDRKIDTLGANQDLIVDFMFSGLGSAEKAAALRSGMLDRRIVCPQDRPDCDRDAVKAAMIERYETDARIRENVELAGSILKGINDVSTIAANLNIPIGKDGQKALEVAGAAVNAYIGIMAGDYLGAVASITGLFRKKSDPDAERFKIMMAYLREQFEAVNRQLQAIQQNQKAIFDAVVGLSQQLETVYVQLDGRLERMEIQMVEISDNLKQLIWAPWQSCFSVYAYALQNGYVDARTLSFPDFTALRHVADARAPQARDCMNTVTVALDSLNSMSGFANFLDLSISLNPASIAGHGNLTAALRDEANKWGHLETLFRNTIANPATRIAEDWAARNGLSDEALFFLLASDLYSVADLQRVRARIAEGGLPSGCSSTVADFAVVRGLICFPGENPAALARRHSRSVLSVDVMLDVVDWMAVVAQLGNIYDKDPGAFAATLTALSRMPAYNAGQEIVARMIDASTLALASQYRLYGQVTALGAAEDIAAGRAGRDHLLLLANNSYLADNTATILLHLKRDSWDLEQGIVGPSFEARYTQALVHAREDVPTRFEPLHALFGRKHAFALDGAGLPSLLIEIDDEKVHLRLPAPTHLVEGRIVYPPVTYALRARKDGLIDRRLDYEFGAEPELALSILEN